MRKQVFFELSAFEDFQNWGVVDRQIYLKIIAIIKEIESSSSNVLERATLLKRELSGYWSIKIEREHRLVYKATNRRIIIIACKYYY